ncbi:MAG TPA: hypothetical protein VNV87_09500, partial [Acidimicrobiales bacterium]|nr:hypothetical protein [Acidimicrobiales bacterium]
TFAERRLGDLVSGAQLTHAQVHDVHGLLAGSQAAQQALAHDAPSLARRLQAVATETFVAGLRAAMIVTAVVCLIGVAAALATRGQRAPAPVGNEGTTPRSQLQGQPAGGGGRRP